ncbi:DUF3363 domain-containing protein [Gluconobacter kondonii]|nr:DUF3363 domain-containing protein [Gluconobacter kondonii]
MTGTKPLQLLSSGKFALVEKSHEFTLVLWRSVIDRQFDQEVTAIVQSGLVAWRLGEREE